MHGLVQSRLILESFLLSRSLRAPLPACESLLDQQGCRGAWAALLKGHFIVRDDTVVLAGAALESVEARWEQGSCHRLVLQQHTSALGFDGLDDSHFAIRYRVCGDEFAHECGSVFEGEAGDRSTVSLHEKIG